MSSPLPGGLLVGRQAELGAVASFLDSIPGAGACLVIEGEAGIGKTAIWRSAVDDASARGYTVLWCRPAESEAGLPFVALDDLLDPVIDRLRAGLTSFQGTVLDGALTRGDVTGGVTRHAVSRAALAAVRELARSAPMLIAIDDAQWLDLPSAGVLEFVARRLGALPVGLLVAQRHEGAPPRSSLARAVDRDRVSSIRIGPLGPVELDALLRSRLDLRLPRPRLLELVRITGGNPLYALEVGRTIPRSQGPSELLAIPIPEDLGALLRTRLARLSDAARETALIAAAASQPTTALVERVLGAPDGLVEAVREEILEMDGPRLRFCHPLLATVVHAAALPGQRRAVHGRLAEAVDDIGERARHLALATDVASGPIARELDRAASVVAARGVPELAAQLAEHAARLTPMGRAKDRRRRLADAAGYHVAAGDPARGRGILEGLIADAEAGPERADMLWRLAESIGDDLRTSITLSEQALAEAGGSAATEARVHTALGVFTWLAGDLERAAGHCRASAACAERAGDRILVAISLGELCHAQTVLGDPYRDEDMRRALELERDLTGFPAYLRPSFQLGVIRMYTDDPVGARPLLQAELERANATRDERARFGALIRLAELDLRAGAWGAALRSADEAAASVLQAGIEQEQSVVLMVQALVRAHLGDLEGARDGAACALAIAETGGDRIVAIRSRGVLGFIELSRHDPIGALAHLGPASRDLRALRVGELSISGVVQNEVEALVAVGRLDEAEEVLAYVEERGRANARSWHAAIVARGRALIAADRGDAVGARAAIDRAMEAHTRLPQPFELGRTLLVAGQIERRLKQRGPARRALTRALELFDELGAPYWAEKAADELARIPGRAPASGDLSETEWRVAELVADGRSNKDIAAQLFVSVRTVEANLSSVYRKLGVQSRTEMAARLRGSPSR